MKLLTILTTVNGIFAINTRLDPTTTDECTTKTGTVLPAEDWVCAILDRLIDRWAHKSPMQIPEQLESYSCEEISVENGDFMCTDGYSGGSICFAMCKPGYLKQETGANHKRCQKKKSWERLLQRGKAPMAWSKNKVSCEKHFIPSPCEIENGGCSHDCLDRGDGQAVCSCPCGYFLDIDKKTCHRSNVCPYDFSFWLDGSDNACNDAAFDTLQREKSQLLMSFFTAYVRDDKAKMAAAFWAEDALTHSIGNYFTENTSVQFLKDQIQDANLQCGLAEIGPVFNHFLESTDRVEDSTSVHVMFLGNQLENSDESLYLNRPKGDNNLVLVPAGWDNQPKLKKQANIIGCGDALSCDRVLDLETVGAEVESFVNREGCLDRVYSSLLSCSEFHMQIEIPKCAFQGLEITDLHFANQEFCSSNPVETDTHFTWEVNYSDCGTIKDTSVEKVISYSNSLKTFLDDQGQTKPILPIFDIPLSCKISTNYEFEFNGDFEIKIDSFETVVNAEGTLTGDLDMYTDSNFTARLSDPIGNGYPIYAQSEIMPEAEAIADLQLVTCVSSPGPIENMAPVDSNLPTWKFINDGCILDETLEILERGPNGELRFTFESFNFHGNTDPIHVQCRYQVCPTADNCATTATCGGSTGGTRRRRRNTIQADTFINVGKHRRN